MQMLSSLSRETDAWNWTPVAAGLSFPHLTFAQSKSHMRLQMNIVAGLFQLYVYQPQQLRARK